MVIIEVCVDDVAGVEIAGRKGADRVELCRELDVGGLTPSLESIGKALAVAPTHGVRVLVRENRESFFLSEDEVEEQARLIEQIRRTFSGAEVPLGFVVGGLERGPDGAVINQAGAQRWREAAGEHSLIFHRAFDELAEPTAALGLLSKLGYTGILSAGSTTGLANPAALGAYRNAQPDLAVIGSGGLRAHNIAQVIRSAGLSEVHFRAPRSGKTGTSEQVVEETVAAVRSLTRSN
ncbi:copper homeostasis protein CutC [Actinomyces minihominis]|uniref:copper homeostasis protein CutC n=1 Tax=Actinomyces minihominis TaxID=2002838 RepID=UPI000C074558|nr:copper homeostasis protein CutC [Actinomyces minihominis]